MIKEVGKIIMKKKEEKKKMRRGAIRRKYRRKVIGPQPSIVALFFEKHVDIKCGESFKVTQQGSSFYLSIPVLLLLLLDSQLTAKVREYTICHLKRH
jgi:hypothetical protein